VTTPWLRSLRSRLTQKQHLHASNPQETRLRCPKPKDNQADDVD
jgi:hypothetical protein